MSFLISPSLTVSLRCLILAGRVVARQPLPWLPASVWVLRPVTWERLEMMRLESTHVHSLEEEGVTIEGVVTVSGTRNQFAFILIDGSTGERTIIWDRDQRLVMLPADVSRDVSRELVSSAKVLLVDGHDAGAAVQAARFAKEAGAVVVMDAERISDEHP